MVQLELRNVFKNFHQGSDLQPVFKDVNVTFNSGTSYAIMGPSGSGKSTLLHMLAGIQAPDQGQVLVDNNLISGLQDVARVAALHQHVGILFQSPSLIGELNVLENVMLPAIARNQMSESNTARAQLLLEQVGLKEKIFASPHSLSGGQQQRVAILRALFHKPMFLLADEPTGNLDEKTALQIIRLLQQYQQDQGMAIILTTHDPVIAKLCDVVLGIHDYKIGNL